jgi:hypothetical protein
LMMAVGEYFERFAAILLIFPQDNLPSSGASRQRG